MPSISGFDLFMFVEGTGWCETVPVFTIERASGVLGMKNLKYLPKQVRPCPVIISVSWVLYFCSCYMHILYPISFYTYLAK
jgi:hypothetical protein